MANKKATLIIAASEVDANLFYACRFLAPDPIVYFSIGKKSYLVLSDLEIDRAKFEAKVDHILSLNDYLKPAAQIKEKTLPAYARIVHIIFQQKKINTIEVPSTFPAEYYVAFTQLGYKIQIKPDPFFKQRLVKTTEEKKYIRHAICQVEVALKEALLLLEKAKIKGNRIYYGKELVTSELLHQVINTKLVSLGCSANNTIIASGVQASFPHHHGSGPIIPHTPIIFDIFPQHTKTRYHADMTRTFVKGKPSREVKKMYQAVKTANRLAREEVRAGANTATIHAAAANYFEKLGFKTGEINGRMQGFIHSTGHGLGIDIHEPPSVSSRKSRLQSGYVVTVEPGLYYEDLGGVRIEDDVYVKPDGYELLTKFPKFFEIDRG